jgi:hypothetical protein
VRQDLRPGETRCGLHARLPEAGTGCEYIFNRRSRQGQALRQEAKGRLRLLPFARRLAEKSDSKEKKPKAPKAEKPKAEKPKEKPSEEKEQIRCVRRAGVAVIKGTCIAIETESTNIIGYVRLHTAARKTT